MIKIQSCGGARIRTLIGGFGDRSPSRWTTPPEALIYYAKCARKSKARICGPVILFLCLLVGRVSTTLLTELGKFNLALNQLLVFARVVVGALAL